MGESKEGFSIKIGEKEFEDKVLDLTFRIPQEAVFKDGRVYLPLRGISEAYGNVVNYSKNNGVIMITIQRNGK
ncbi:stalk domain-containing protein [Paenibacillus sp. Soil522]|uniref:stalk domain-containing protein n=1 Tax=Paenibacillus sp. Soil522 TaxID=1736388 RepID=UPI0012DC50D2